MSKIDFDKKLVDYVTDHPEVEAVYFKDEKLQEYTLQVSNRHPIKKDRWEITGEKPPKGGESIPANLLEPDMALINEVETLRSENEQLKAENEALQKAVDKSNSSSDKTKK